MNSMLVVVALACALVILASQLKANSAERAGPYRYASRPAMSDVEQVLYHRLRRALPNRVILAQVAMSRVLTARAPRQRAAFCSIAQKSLDFVVCGPDGTVLAVIELDDNSHLRPTRRRADSTKDAALASAGIRVIRWKAQDLPDTETIRQTLSPLGPRALDVHGATTVMS
ncbi:MAG: DUF2726 domain-containing protein [Rhodocyclaceae bacterium]